MLLGAAHGVLEAPVGRGTPCYKKTNYITLLYDVYRFQKYIWQRWVTTKNFTLKNLLSPVFLVKNLDVVT